MVSSLRRRVQEEQEGDDQPSYIEVPLDEQETPVPVGIHDELPFPQQDEEDVDITPQLPPETAPLQEADFEDVFIEGETSPLHEVQGSQPEEETSPFPEPPVPGFENMDDPAVTSTWTWNT